MTSGLWPNIRAELNGEFWVPKATLFTINGMGSPDGYGFGFSADTARGLMDVADGLYIWIPISYPAAPFPMDKSVKVGIENTVAAIKVIPGKIALSGYSEGAMVMDRVWRDEILNPKGRLHARLPDVIAIVNYGDPMHCPGISNGNLRAGFPLPKKVDGYTTGGICGPGDLKPEETPDFLMSCNNDGDMYVSAPVGDTPWIKETPPGHDETLIFSVVQSFSAGNILAIVKEVIGLLNVAGDASELTGSLIPVIQGKPSESHVIGMVQALLGAGMFFVVKGLAPHMDYAKMVPAMVDYLIERANAV